MLDLKAKLAAAGLVSPEEVARAEAEREAKKRGRGRERGGGPTRGGRAGAPSKNSAPGKKPAPSLDVASLSKLDPKRSKNELYDAVRRFVEASRLDPVGRMPSEHARSFHFPTEQGGIGRLVIEPHLSHALGQGEAAVVAYMSNHGLAHAVVSAGAARAIAQLFPTWLRSLVGHTPTPDAAPDADAAASGQKRSPSPT